MASNPYVNKVTLASGQTLIDLTSDTVAEDKMLSGITAHDKSGASISGSIGNGTITNNTSGGTSSGTINRGSQIKIGKGYYASDKYYQAQANSGTKNITSSGTTSVDGYANASVAAGSATTPATTIAADPVISVSSSGLITAITSATKSVTPTVSEGYVSSGTAGTVSVSGSTTKFLSTESGKTVTPTRSEQIAVAKGKYTTGVINVAAIPDSYYTLQEVYPVGSLWATYDDTALPGTVLGFGTWTKVSPIRPTWRRLKATTTYAEMAADSPEIYVWRRTA